jgi:hypothetical protein
MTGPTVTYKVDFARRPESRLTAPPAPPCAPTTATAEAPDAAPAASPIARMLALAHHVERLVEAGVLKDYADAAHRLGMAKSHMTHLTNLLRLAPEIQEAILSGSLDVAERALRSMCSQLEWDAQARALASVRHSRKQSQ